MSPVESTPTASPLGIRKEPRRTDNRLREIERARVGSTGLPAALSDPFPGFSGLGVATVGDVANIWEAQLAHSYVEALISCLASGGSTCSFDFELNGAPLLTLSLLTGEVRHAYVAVFSINPLDRLGGTVTAAGGQIAISVQLREQI